MKYTLTPWMLEQLHQMHEEDDLRTSYSGRGMMGRTCLGYTGDEELLFALDLARALCGEPEDGDSPDSYYSDLRETVADIGDSYRTDSMGLSTIHYWPNVTMQEEP